MSWGSTLFCGKYGVTRWSHGITNCIVVGYNGMITRITNDNKNFLPTAAPPKICHFASNPSPRRGPIFDRISRARQKRPIEGFGTNLPESSEPHDRNAFLISPTPFKSREDKIDPGS